MGWSDAPESSRRTALDFAARALRAGGDDPDVLANVARAMVFIGEDVEAAGALVKRAVQQNPGSWSV
jgi:cytochrome c-type biogenesis protein CcmH/NrfG